MLNKRIEGKYRLLLLGSAVLYIFAFFLPLWRITLDAPQYPESLGMYIYINKVTGESKHDLQNINILNHYIGMKAIDNDAISELKYMPYFLGFLVALGFAAYAYPRRWVSVAVLITIIFMGIAGLTDFYLWEYDYGHNLNPEAPIIIPGMSYQPPLIFCQQLLNITACSFPYVGSIAILAGALMTAFSIRKAK